MTTNVTVEAHCGKDNFVSVMVLDKGKVVESMDIQDGEESVVYAYDDRVVSVREAEKGIELTAA